MNKINPRNVLFIKLGEKGGYEQECLLEKQTLRVGFTDIDHKLCENREWKTIWHILKTGHTSYTDSTATNQTNQLKTFYEEDEETLWITFHANKLWWCFAKSGVTVLPDNSRERKAIGSWSDKDIYGNTLLTGNISGKLLKTQGFRATLCSVPARDYAIAKINGEKLPEVQELEDVLHVLASKLAKVIQNLQWKDYETLIDLIFREAGWQRVSDIGKTQKTLDLDLFAPVTGERAIVQIKAQSDKAEFIKYCGEFADMPDYDRFFYVVHTPSNDLFNYKNDSGVELYMVNKVADLAISAGLVNWIMRKVS